MQAFVGAMPRVRPHYAVKSNPHGGMLQGMVGLGCGFDCASAAEIRQALTTGVQPADIIFAHTCKLPGDIRYAASMGVHVRRCRSLLKTAVPRSCVLDCRCAVRSAAQQPCRLTFLSAAADL